ncbi:thiamine pyrophosphate-binding protein [Aspergillus saccharolyticus JOP 1030-1]|uniref:Acetolactate synthase n=1 Tax=Aspergillus saccharolyticus JOP 1030-1 TaxID=1450539 RepID=A0A318Z4K7_9EURO|nr:acetolactate synthase [Aspergillus saccharolyticus JOP 1030-1]PYH42245.1 acetolactate synthase [Aspergillus saccharolyticus JOP 1030-1]
MTRTESPHSQPTGGEYICEELARRGVKHAFGISGGAIFPVFDRLHSNPPLTLTLTLHEQGAGHMAEGYARASGRPGVVFVTSGPGTSNLVTPLMDALIDGVPLIAICGQVPTPALGTGAFQEIDSLGLAKTCTKWCGMPTEVDELPAYLAQAFDAATTGRPGPTMLVIPKDVAKARLSPRAVEQSPNLQENPSPSESLPTPSQKTLDEVARLLRRAQKPVIIAGQGLLNATDGPALLQHLTEIHPIPTTTTLLGLGAFDELSPLALGMLGTYGTVPADLAVQHADLILALGARLDERAVGSAAEFAPAARKAAKEGRGGIVHFDICPQHMGRVVKPTVAVAGDLARTLPLLLERVQSMPPGAGAEWVESVQQWKRQYPLDLQPLTPTGKEPMPQEVIAELDRQLSPRKDRTMVTTGVGQHQMWTARYFRWRVPRGLISSGGLGTMGFGVPAAVGAKMARPDCTVLDIDGDASLCMTMQEILTAVQYGVAIKVLVLRNEEQGMVQEVQRVDFDGRITQADHLNPDFVQLAESMGARGRRCVHREDLSESIAWLLKTEGVALLEVGVQGRVPMVPKVNAGKGLKGILDGLDH